MRADSKIVVFASIAANVAIAATKLIVGVATNSTAMLAEGAHSVVDSFDGILLLVGDRRARRPADASHPFGHGREAFFWSLIVALLFFALGGVLSVYEGVSRLLSPRPIGDPTWSYVVLAVAAAFDGTSFVIGFRTFRRHAHGRRLWRALRESKRPAVFSVVLEDAGDLAGLAIAFLGVFLSHALRRPYLDGLASVLIGLVLLAIATLLLVETHSLLIGESASTELVQAVASAIGEQPALIDCGVPATIQLAPDSVLVAVHVAFAPHRSADEIATAIDDMGRRIRARYPDVRRILVDVTSTEVRSVR